MGDLGWWPGNTGDEVIIGAILTQNTNWNNVEKSLCVLRSRNLIDLSRIAGIEKDDLSPLIRSSGFHNQKAERIVNLSRSITEKYGSVGDMAQSDSMEVTRFLGSIKGVGQETRDAILLYALDIPVFVVDKYTIRIFSRIGIIESPDAMPRLKKEVPLLENMTVERLKNFHGMIVKLAKDHCRKNPVCKGCPLSLSCRYYTEVMLP